MIAVAFGMGFVVASLVAWWIGITNHDVTLAGYWPVIPAFGIGMGSGLIASRLPQGWAEFWVHIANAEKARADAR